MGHELFFKVPSFRSTGCIDTPIYSILLSSYPVDSSHSMIKSRVMASFEWSKEASAWFEHSNINKPKFIPHIDIFTAPTRKKDASGNKSKVLINEHHEMLTGFVLAFEDEASAGMFKMRWGT